MTNPAIPVALCALPLLVYATAAIHQVRIGRHWSAWRSGSFSCGILLVLFALYPTHAHHSEYAFTAHMNQHLLIGMLAPTFLVMGAPVSLVLRTVPQALGKWCVRMLHSRPLRIWCHPLTAFAFNFGGMFILYLTPLYRLSLDNPVLHHFIHLHFLLAGYLFAWGLVGPDPGPVRLQFRTRLGILLLAMACHGIFSKLMYIHLFPFDTPHSAEDIRTGAQRMYYGGDMAEVLLAILLFYQQRHHTRRRPVRAPLRS
ncbi:MAG: cytochrome c oxidase assembly protein [Cellvibrionaceae bacterium]|nr:cytochrome c oxidase assembly protein [Cellvibrionaceae bacterium]